MRHPQFFRAVTFESQRFTDDGATVDPSHGLRLGTPVLITLTSRTPRRLPDVSPLGAGW